MPTPEQIEAAEAQIIENSRRIDYYIVEYSFEVLAAKMANGDLQIPAYQRDDTWEPARKSRFIESLLMNLPIPFLFFWESPTGKLEIVDGCQRLRTIQQFLEGRLVLSAPLSQLNRLEGFYFTDLPLSRQRKIKNRSIRGIILNEHTAEADQFEIFDRINTGSKIANKAEIRRGILRGPFLDLVVALAKDPAFMALAPASNQDVNRREREELVTRFFAYSDGLTGYKDRPSQFLSEYMRDANQRFQAMPGLTDTYGRRFHETMDFVARVFPRGFRRAKDGSKTPRSRFEAIAIGSYLALAERPDLRHNTVDVSTWVDGGEFKEVVGADGANAIGRLRGRINYVKDRLIGAVGAAT